MCADLPSTRTTSARSWDGIVACWPILFTVPSPIFFFPRNYDVCIASPSIVTASFRTRSTSLWEYCSEMNYLVYRRWLVCAIFLSTTLAAAQASLRAHVELTRNGHRAKDASNAVVWLTPIGGPSEPPRQEAAKIPQLVQKNKSFHPSLLVIPVGGKVEFPNQDPIFHN